MVPVASFRKLAGNLPDVEFKLAVLWFRFTRGRISRRGSECHVNMLRPHHSQRREWAAISVFAILTASHAFWKNRGSPCNNVDARRQLKGKAYS